MFGVMQDMPAVSESDYRLVEKHLGPDRPAGLVAHVSGPTHDGWRVINVWRSEDDFRRFQSERLRPSGSQTSLGPVAAGAGGMSSTPAGRGCEGCGVSPRRACSRHIAVFSCSRISAYAGSL